MSLYFSYGDVKKIAFDILHALSFLNAQGIVHRDLSPANISLTPKVTNWKLFFTSPRHLVSTGPKNDKLNSSLPFGQVALTQTLLAQWASLNVLF